MYYSNKNMYINYKKPILSSYTILQYKYFNLHKFLCDVYTISMQIENENVFEKIKKEIGSNL